MIKKFNEFIKEQKGSFGEPDLKKDKCDHCGGELEYVGPGDYKRQFKNGNPTDYKREQNFKCKKCGEPVTKVEESQHESIKDSKTIDDKLPFQEAFDKYIKGQTVVSTANVPAYGDYNLPHNERYYGSGMEFDNGYKILYHGGGCSGSDCNVTFILSPDDKVISRKDW